MLSINNNLHMITSNTQENGNLQINMDKEHKFGQMVLNMKANGKIIRLMDRVYLQIITETFTMENGKETKLMDKANTLKVTALYTKALGNMIYSMEKLKNNLMIFQSSKENITEVKSKGKMDAVFGLTDQNILEVGMIIKDMGMANTHGKTKDNSKVIGERIKCTGKEYLLGKIVENTLGLFQKINSMETEPTHRLMEKNMKENGLMESNMALENSIINLRSLKKANGNLENGQNGQMRMSKSLTKIKIRAKVINLLKT